MPCRSTEWENGRPARRLALSGLSLISWPTNNSVKSTKSHLVDQISFFDLLTRQIFDTLLRLFNPPVEASISFMYSDWWSFKGFEIFGHFETIKWISLHLLEILAPDESSRPFTFVLNIQHRRKCVQWSTKRSIPRFAWWIAIVNVLRDLT